MKTPKKKWTVLLLVVFSLMLLLIAGYIAIMWLTPGIQDNIEMEGKIYSRFENGYIIIMVEHPTSGNKNEKIKIYFNRKLNSLFTTELEDIIYVISVSQYKVPKSGDAADNFAWNSMIKLCYGNMKDSQSTPMKNVKDIGWQMTLSRSDLKKFGYLNP